MLSWSQGGIIRSFPGHHRLGQHGDVRWAYPGCIGVVPSGSRRRLEHKAETGQLLRPLSARPLGDTGRHEKPGGFVTPLIISGTNFSRSHRKTQIECLLSQVLGGGDERPNLDPCLVQSLFRRLHVELHLRLGAMCPTKRSPGTLVLWWRADFQFPMRLLFSLLRPLEPARVGLGVYLSAPAVPRLIGPITGSDMCLPIGRFAHQAEY